MIYIFLANGDTKMDEIKKVDIENDSANTRIEKDFANVANGVQMKEDDVDIRLWKENGRIERSKDSKFCRHGANAKCVYCTPIEPYDDEYLKEHKIKHMSFQAYLRKLTGGMDK